MLTCMRASLAFLLLLPLTGCGSEEAAPVAPGHDRAPPASAAPDLPDITALEAAARSGEVDARVDAIFALGSRTEGADGERAQAILRSLLQDPLPELRRAALDELPDAAIAAVEETLIVWLADSEEPNRDDAYDRLVNSDFEAEARIERALTIALAEPDSDLAALALDDMIWASHDRNEALIAAVLEVARSASDPLRRLKAYRHVGEWSAPKLAEQVAHDVVALVRRHEGAMPEEAQRDLHMRAVRVLATLGPEAAVAASYLRDVMQTAPPQGGPPPDDSQLLGMLFPDFSDRPSEAAANELARLGPLASDVYAPLYAWIEARDLPLDIFTRHVHPWGDAPLPAVDLARRRLWDARHVEGALVASVHLAPALEEELLRVWGWLTSDQREAAFVALMHGEAPAGLLLERARELVAGSGIQSTTSSVVLAVLLTEPGPSTMRMRAEKALWRRLQSADPEVRRDVLSALTQVEAHAARAFLPFARRLVVEDYLADPQADLAWFTALALLLRAGGDDRARALMVAERTLRKDQALWPVLGASEAAGDAGRLLLPLLLEHVDRNPEVPGVLLSLFLGTIGNDTPRVRAILERLRAGPHPLTRLWAAGSLHRLSNR